MTQNFNQKAKHKQAWEQRSAVHTSTELPTDGYQGSKPAQSEHGGDDGFDPEREIVPDSSVEPLVVEKDDEGGEDAEEVHYRYHLFG